MIIKTVITIIIRNKSPLLQKVQIIFFAKLKKCKMTLSYMNLSGAQKMKKTM